MLLDLELQGLCLMLRVSFVLQLGIRRQTSLNL